MPTEDVRRITIPMPGAPGTHTPFRPTLEQRANLDRQYPQATFARRDHAAAVLARRGPEPTSSHMQGFELLGGAL